MMKWKTEGTKLYQQLPSDMYESWKECEPLRDIALQKAQQPGKSYFTWNENKKD